MNIYPPPSNPSYNHSGQRLILPLNDHWAFLPEKPRKDWLNGSWPTSAQAVSLPHSWNERDTFQQGLRYRQGDGFYGCRFHVPERTPELRPAAWQLRSGGFYGTGAVWLNGQRIAHVDGQYLGFTLDVTAHLNFGGMNTLAVSLNNRYHPHVLPGKKMPDFLLHGGLAGELTLCALPPVHLNDQSLGVLCRTATAESANLEMRTTIHNQSNSAVECRLRITILTKDGPSVHTQVSDIVRVATGAATPVIVPFTLSQPNRWRVNDPYLYTLRAELIMHDNTCDTATSRFGVRTARFDGELGFLLNDEPLYLQGVNRHECLPGFGNALPSSLQREDANRIKALGLNLVRLAHYPQHPAFLDACDELGVLVYAEIASWKSARPGLWTRAACRQLTAMVERDRRHPSIILWGLANESRSRIAFKKMQHLLKGLDPTRHTIYAENHLHRGLRWRTTKLVDVLGVNYELDRLSDARAASRNGAVLISEMSNCARTRRGDFAAELDQVKTYHLDFTRAGRGATGYTLWSFNDYPTQRKHRIIRRPGVVDAWRLPKMASAYLQARILTEPMVRIYGNWSRQDASGKRALCVISNCERIIIRCGDDVLVERACDLLLEAEADYRAAPLEVIGLRNGVEAARDALQPHGKAVRLVVEAEQNEAKASDRAVVGIRVKAVDAEGEPDRLWIDAVRMQVDGPARDRCYTADNQIEMGGGLGRAFIQGNGATGRSTVHVTHDRLSGGSTTVSWR